MSHSPVSSKPLRPNRVVKPTQNILSIKKHTYIRTDKNKERYYHCKIKGYDKKLYRLTKDEIYSQYPHEVKAIDEYNMKYPTDNDSDSSDNECSSDEIEYEVDKILGK